MNTLSEPLTRLYEPGAPAADGFIPLSVPHLNGNEWDYVKECLDSGWVSSAGPFVERFERALADRTGARFAIAVASGTAALHTALLVAGIQPDEEVITSSISFIASANAIRYVGAWPRFVDAEPSTWQIDPQQVHDFLKQSCTVRAGKLVNRATGRRVSALLPVHVLGHSVDLDPLRRLAGEFGLPVIEDAAEALGARYKDRPIGQPGDLVCLSFNGNKVVTAGGGGMLLTNNASWAERARYLTTQAKDDPIEYVHHTIGYNYRLTSLQAALGLAQVERLDDHLAAKRAIAERYGEALNVFNGVSLQGEATWAHSARWLSTVLFEERTCGIGSREVLRLLGQEGIQVRPLWQPLHQSPALADGPEVCLPVAERLHRDALSLPCSVSLTEEQQKRVIDAIVRRLR